MTSIQIDKVIRNLLKDSIKEGAIDDKLNILMDNSEKPSEQYRFTRDSSTKIRVNPETLERLKQHKLYNTESHSGVILRLLNDYHKD